MPQPRRAASQPGVSAVPSSAHAEPGWTREELSGNHAAREDQGRGKPSCTPLYTHRSVTARNGQNSSSPSTSVDIPAAPHRASRLTLPPCCSAPPARRDAGARHAAAARPRRVHLSTGRHARPEITSPWRPAGSRRAVRAAQCAPAQCDAAPRLRRPCGPPCRPASCCTPCSAPSARRDAGARHAAAARPRRVHLSTGRHTRPEITPPWRPAGPRRT